MLKCVTVVVIAVCAFLKNVVDFCDFGALWGHAIFVLDFCSAQSRLKIEIFEIFDGER